MQYIARSLCWCRCRCRCAPNFFSEKGSRGWEFVEIGYFDNHFVKNIRKRGPAGKYFWAFCPSYSWNFITTFWKENLTQWWTQSRLFFPNSWNFFRLSKWAGRASSPPPPPPTPLLARLWEWLNIHQFSGISLNILENAWINNCSDYARTLNVCDHLKCFWKCLWF